MTKIVRKVSAMSSAKVGSHPSPVIFKHKNQPRVEVGEQNLALHQSKLKVEEETGKKIIVLKKRTK